MPDLSRQAVNGWLSSLDRPFAVSIIELITVPEAPPASDQAVKDLGTALDGARQRDPTRLVKELSAEPALSPLKTVLAQVSPVRRLRMLDWFCEPDLADGETILRALTKPDESGNGDSIRAEIVSLNRRGLLAKIFHEKRVQALLAACEDIEGALT
jgi:hypothetical protein